MKVLFVCSGNNRKFDIIPFIKEQGEALVKKGVEINYFPVVGKGVLGYIKAGLQLKKHLRTHPYDLIHAHFTYSGLTAIIGAGKLPVVLSLMGSDAYGTYVGVNKVTWKSRINTLLTFLAQPFASAIISKSKNIERYVYLKHRSFIIPNGINVERFRPHTGAGVQQGAGSRKLKVLFLGDKNNPRKNFKLVQEAVEKLSRTDVEIVTPYPVAHDAIPAYLNAADVVVVPSLMEGSPNVVKEAMACNCPIVATDVGDVRWVLGNTPGSYVASFDVNDFSEKLARALTYAATVGRTVGAERIRELGLDNDTVSRRVIEVYKKVAPLAV